MGTFLRAFSMEIINIGSTFETFIDSTLKNENAAELVELYQLIREMIDEIVKINEILNSNRKNWREHAKFYEELSKIVDLIPLTIIQEFFDQILPSLIEQMKNGSDKLKKASALLVITLIFYVPNSEKRNKIMSELLLEFANTRSSVLRKAFIDLCIGAL